MDVRVGDILTMKKPHPCGEKRKRQKKDAGFRQIIGAALANKESFKKTEETEQALRGRRIQRKVRRAVGKIQPQKIGRKGKA